jgi:hypothetical protein
MARNVEHDYPNRDKTASKVMRVVVLVVLLVSTGLIAAVSIKGWDLMDEARTLNIAFIVINLIFVVQVVRWSRGVLPMAAGVATFIAIFAGVSVQSWYQRDAVGFNDASLSSEVGFLTIVLFAVQFVVIAATVFALSQNWQEEIERVVPEGRSDDGRRPQGTVPA